MNTISWTQIIPFSNPNFWTFPSSQSVLPRLQANHQSIVILSNRNMVRVQSLTARSGLCMCLCASMYGQTNTHKYIPEKDWSQSNTLLLFSELFTEQFTERIFWLPPLLLLPWTLRKGNAGMRAFTNRLWTCPLDPPMAVYLIFSNYDMLVHHPLCSLHPPFLHGLNMQFTSFIMLILIWRCNTISMQEVLAKWQIRMRLEEICFISFTEWWSCAAVLFSPFILWLNKGLWSWLVLYHQQRRIYIQQGEECRIHLRLKMAK